MGSKGRTVLILLLFLISSAIITTGSESQEREPWGYHNSFEIEGILRNLAENHPDITEFTTAQSLLQTRGITGEKVIPILFVGDRSDSGRPWVMIIGAHHGNEQDSAESVLAFAVDLIEGYDNGEERSIKIVGKTNLAILPVVNPYGLDMGIRYDENGEDPNRDYPFDPDPEGVPLTTAGAHAVHSLAKMYPFTLAVSYHTGSKGVYTPWGADLPGSRSPDRLCLQELSDALVRSSGAVMESGPANDYPGLGYLNGAFDDHLYGSTFMSDELYDENMILPHSTATATLEIWDYKGQDPQKAGDPDDIWNPSAGGSVPIGMRMAYASCQIASPDMEVRTDRNGDVLTLSLDCTGFDDPEDVSVRLGSGNTSLEIDPLQIDIHPFMPEMEIRYTFDLGSLEDDAIVEVKASPDSEWTHLEEEIFPDISPQSLLSRSRGEQILWTDVIRIRNEPVVKEADLINTLYPREVMAGEYSSVSVNFRSVTDSRIESLDIHCNLNGLSTSISYVREDLFDEYDLGQYPLEESYFNEQEIFPFVTPAYSGYGDVDVWLRTEDGEYHEATAIKITPLVWVESWSFVGEKGHKRLSFKTEVRGVTSQSWVIYGIHNSENAYWDSKGWLVGPILRMVYEDTSITMETELPKTYDEVYLHVSSSPDATDENPVKIKPPFVIYASNLTVNVMEDEIIFGPAIVLASGYSGMEEADGTHDNFRYIIKIWDQKGRLVNRTYLEWVTLEELTPGELEELRFYALKAGFDPDSLTGAWRGGIESLKMGEYGYSGIVTDDKHVTIAGSEYAGTRTGDDSDTICGTFKIEPEDEDEFIFSWKILVIFFLIIMVVFVISIIRYPAHHGEPQTDDAGKAPPLTKKFPHGGGEHGSGSIPYDGTLRRL